MNYNPQYLSWCKTYSEEVAEMRSLILANPSDVKQLRAEYQQLTGTRFRRKKDE